MQKWQKFVFRKGDWPCFRKHGFFVIFVSSVSSIIQKWKKNYKNMRTTIIDIKFDALPCKGKPENAENCRKIIKLLVEKKRCEKIPSAPITIWKSIKKGNFWRLINVLKPASILVITVFLFTVFWISRLFLYQ